MPFVMSGSLGDATREPSWETPLIILMLTFAVAGTSGWRYARGKLGPDVPIPGTTLETTLKIARAAAQIRIAILLVGGLVLFATGILLTQVYEIVIGLVGIVWSLLALRSLRKSE